MHPQNKRAQVLEEPMPQGNAGNGPEQLTTNQLIETLSELIDLDYIYVHRRNGSKVQVFGLTEKRP